MAGPDDRSHNRHRERLARPARAVPGPAAPSAGGEPASEAAALPGGPRPASRSGPEHDTCGRYSGYSEDTTADNVSSPGPRTRRGYSKDSQNGARDNGGSVRGRRTYANRPVSRSVITGDSPGMRGVSRAAGYARVGDGTSRVGEDADDPVAGRWWRSTAPPRAPAGLASRRASAGVTTLRTMA
jgi:hypothetical protein